MPSTAAGFWMVGTAAVALLSGNASAQDVSAQTVPPSSSTNAAPPSTAVPSATTPSNSGQINDIVVTAQKRTENVQDVPIAISAFSADMLAARGAINPQELQHSVPGLVFTVAASGVGTVVERGVGGTEGRSTVPGVNPAVPIHVNGVYLQSPSIMLQDFLDIERIEVLRGPQGTLYGRNALGGSINIITARPTNTLHGGLGVEIGNYNERKVTGFLSGPLTQGLRARLAFALENRDPFFINIDDRSDNRLQNSRYYNVRGTLEYDVTSNILASVTGFAYHRSGANYTFAPRSLPGNDGTGSPGFAGVSIYNTVPAGYQLSSFKDPRKVQHDTRGDGFDTTRGATGDVRWDLGGATLRSISGYFYSSTGNTYDGDGTDLPQAKEIVSLSQTYKTFSEELQLSSNGTGRLKWLLAGYFYHENSQSAIIVDYRTSSSPFFLDLATNPGKVNSRSLAAFGQLDYNLTDKLVLTAGLRYTADRIKVLRSSKATYFGFPLAALPDYTNVPDQASFSKPTWKFSANYHLTPDVLFYATYSRGYRSGGFNLQDLEPAYKPETLDDFEGGFKTSLLDRHLQLNGGLFYYKYKNKQEVRQGANNLSAYENAAKSHIKGAELEIQARPDRNLSFDASLSYLDAKYDSFDTADSEQPQLGVQNLAGRSVTDAPPWQAHVGVEYGRDLGSGLGRLSLRVDQSITDNSYVRPFNLVTDRIPSYARTNARVLFESADSHVTAELYVRNIQNYNTISSFAATGGFNANIHQIAYLEPRTYGFKLGYKF